MNSTRKDEFIGPLSIISLVALIGVKGLTAIVFVFLVLSAGLKNINSQALIAQDNKPVVEPAAPSHPLPNFSVGLQQMPIVTPMPTIETPTLEFTFTKEPTFTTFPTETGEPTLTFTPTNTTTATFTPSPTGTKAPPTATATVSIPPTRTNTVKPTVAATATSFPQFTPNASVGPFYAISPLWGISTNELYTIISQPFIAPAPGEDSGHHGVDLAFWKRGDLSSIEGVSIAAVFSGKVASAYSKIRNPYGYMVIIETPLKDLPSDFMDTIQLPTETVPSNPSNRLTCPAGFADWWSTDEQSLYVLYGHMADVPLVKRGDLVYQDQELGVVGNTGASSNPHLHLEMRIGPSDASFISMGHYDSTTTDLERHNYCMWRISGEFVLFDPMELYPQPEAIEN